MSAVVPKKKRERQSASQAPARHSGEGRNPVCLASPQRDSSSVGGSVWKELRLDEVVEIIRGITFPSAAKAKVPSNDSIACLRTANVQREVGWDDLWYVARSFVKRDSQFVRERDILISNANSYELVGKVAFIRNVPTPATLGTFITLFRTRSGNDPRFIYFQLSSSEVQAAIRSMASTTTNISNISTTKLAQIVLRFPPLSKQRKIVAEIEKQFTRLDAGVAALRRVEANLKRYRAAVLKAACEGRLVPTEAELAKAEGRTYETGEQLLARVLADRRKNSQGRGKYKEPAAPDTKNLPVLPDGWTWATFERSAERVTVGFVGSMKHEYTTNGVPFLRSQNVRENYFDPKGLLYVSPKFHEKLAKSTLHSGDLVVVRSGAVGVTCVIPVSLPEANCSDLVLIQRPFGFVSQYGAYYMNSLAKRHVIAGKVGVALTHFNTRSVAAIPLPVPPLAEQQRIVAEVERRLSVIDELEAVVSTNIQRAIRLRQSVLQCAFTEKGIGRLFVRSLP